jgi:hypothetical protein
VVEDQLPLPAAVMVAAPLTEANITMDRAADDVRICFVFIGCVCQFAWLK